VPVIPGALDPSTAADVDVTTTAATAPTKVRERLSETTLGSSP